MNSARQAIITRYMGPTNTRGSRIRAICERGAITVSYPSNLDGQDCHTYAVDQLLRRFAAEDGNDKSWGTIDDWVAGAMPQNIRYSYCYVNLKHA